MHYSRGTEEHYMNRYATMLIAAVLAGAAALQAQESNPMSTAIRQMYTGVKNNLENMAEKMPEGNYSFKPTPEIRSFAQMVAHVADSQARMCSAINGESKSVNAGSQTAKAELVAALKESFSICDQAFEALTDATAAQPVRMGRMERPRLAGLVGVLAHSDEEYGYMAVYLRLKGIVPPSSARR